MFVFNCVNVMTRAATTLLYILYAIQFLLLLDLNDKAKADVSGKKLMVFLIDGFRHDYIHTVSKLSPLPGFQKMINEGGKAEYMIPDFPTLSFPNYYTLMTGLHTEHHGMVGNYMFDPDHNTTFLLGTNPEYLHPYWWDDGEPLWITAERQHKKAHMYWWPGCEVTIRGYKASYCKQFQFIEPEINPTMDDLRDSIDSGIQAFKHQNISLVGIYVKMVDEHGHRQGPSMAQATIMDVDKEFSRLLQLLNSEGLNDVNIVIVGDHGMIDISAEKVIDINPYISADDITEALDCGPVCYIWPKDGRIDKVYNDLKRIQSSHLQIYKKDQIPDRWHFKGHKRTPPLLLVADPGWFLLTPRHPSMDASAVKGSIKGYHGYDNMDMSMMTTFIAYGPDIRPGVVLPPMSSVNVYELMCALLDLEPSPNDGQLSVVQPLLYPVSTNFRLVYILGISGTFIATLFICNIYCAKQSSKSKVKKER